MLKIATFAKRQNVRHNTAMTTKLLQLIIILSLTSCGQGDKPPDKFKAGLLDFKVKKSEVSEQLEGNKPLDFGALWVGFNRINANTNHDTLIIDVNVNLSTSLNYDGGFEVVHDTLFLYAKRLDKTHSKKTVHSTLTYKIVSKGLTYKKIEFKETE